MKFAVCNEMFEGQSWEEQCRLIAEVGYTGVEVAPFTIPGFPEAPTHDVLSGMRHTAESAGLEIIGLHWLLAKTEGLYLTSPEESVRVRTADYLIHLARINQTLGGRVMVLGSPQQRNLLPGVSFEGAMNFAEDVLRRILPTLIETGSILCLEPLSPAETDFMNTCADAVALMERLDSPAVRLHLDVKAMAGGEAIPVADVIRHYQSYCGHFHANDTNLLGPGMGDTDFVPIFQALHDSRYSDWVSVEVFDYAPGAEHIARVSLQHMQALQTATR